MHVASLTPDLRFRAAAALWIDSRTFSGTAGATGMGGARYIKPNTESSYRQYIASLNLFFGEMQLSEIHLGNLRGYQIARVGGAPPFIRRRRPHELPGPCPAKPKKANQELAILECILTRAGCWTKEMEDFHENLQVDESDVPRALSPEEQFHWLDVAKFKQRWHLVYWYSELAFGTTMSTNEERGLRLGDVSLFHRVVNIPNHASKTRGRHRTIELVSAEEMWAAEQLLERARQIGSIHPQHYLFPFRRSSGPWDPRRPMTSSGIKRLWQEVRDASGLRWFRMYDTRHTAITRMAEAGIHPAIMEAKAGHLTERMRRHYTHISQSAQRRAVEEAYARMRIPPRRDGFNAGPSAPAYRASTRCG